MIPLQAFKYGSSVSANRESLPQENQEILHCELTKAEFAEALSLKMDSLFIENMFNLVDKDNDGYVSFREFLDVIVIFAIGVCLNGITWRHGDMASQS